MRARGGAWRVGVVVLGLALGLGASPARSASRPTGAPTFLGRGGGGHRWRGVLEAVSALTRGQTQRAQVLLSQIGAPRSRPVALTSAIALCQALRGDLDGGLRTLRRPRPRVGGWVDAHYHQAVIAVLRGRLPEARRALHRAETLGGDRPRFLMLEALLSRRTGQATQARRALTRLAHAQCDLLDPGLYPDLLTELVRSLGRLLRGFPRAADAEATLGNALLTLRRYRQSEVWFRAALRRSRGHAAALLGMARLRLVWGDAPGALRLSGRAVARAPQAAVVWATRAEVRLLLGQSGGALGDLKHALRIDPRDALNLSRLGDLLWDQGAWARAERTYRYALKQSPRLASARFGLARALARRGRRVEALRSYRAAAALNPASPRYHLSLAVALERAGHAQEAAQVRARAQVAARLSKQFERRVAGALQTGQLVRRICRVARAGALEGARRLLGASRLPPGAAALIRAYLALRSGGRADPQIARVAAALWPARLLSSRGAETTRISVKGVVAPSVPVTLQRYLPFVNPSRFR